MLTAATNVRKRLLDYTREEFDRVVALNLGVAFDVVRVFGADMAARGRGSIIGFSLDPRHDRRARSRSVRGDESRPRPAAPYCGRGVRPGRRTGQRHRPRRRRDPSDRADQGEPEWYDAYAREGRAGPLGAPGRASRRSRVPRFGRFVVRDRLRARRGRRLDCRRRPLRPAGLVRSAHDRAARPDRRRSRCAVPREDALAGRSDRSRPRADRSARAGAARVVRVRPFRRARDDAKASEARWRRGEPLGPIDGVPLTLKENIATRGTPVPLGTAATALVPAAEDAPAAARVRESGGVLLAKTTMPDYGMLTSGVSSFHDTARNPWRPPRTPGGSSAGAAAAAAAGYGPLHVGTDIGGSIRLPAGWCGLVGLKPSFGRVPVDPPFLGRVAGPMTRTVADTALLMSVLSRPDARDHLQPAAADLDWSRWTSRCRRPARRPAPRLRTRPPGGPGDPSTPSPRRPGSSKPPARSSSRSGRS